MNTITNAEQIIANLTNAGEKGALEAGHYYQSIGQTLQGAAGWVIANNLIQPKNKIMLLVDDIHSVAQAPHVDAKDIVPDWNPKPTPDIVVKESETVSKAHSLISLFLGNSLAKPYKDKIMFKNGWFPIEIKGSPTCAVMDCALSLIKWQDLNLNYFVNILPKSYMGQQGQLQNLISGLTPLLGFNQSEKSFDTYLF
jgi:hypothetical protein